LGRNSLSLKSSALLIGAACLVAAFHKDLDYFEEFL